MAEEVYVKYTYSDTSTHSVYSHTYPLYRVSHTYITTLAQLLGLYIYLLLLCSEYLSVLIKLHPTLYI